MLARLWIEKVGHCLSHRRRREVLAESGSDRHIGQLLEEIRTQPVVCAISSTPQ